MVTKKNTLTAESHDLEWLHASLQYSDTLAQKKHDVRKLFAFDTPIITVTEVGEADYWAILQLACKLHDFKATRYRSNAIMVSKDIIKPGSWKTGHVFVKDTSLVVGKGHDSAFPWATWEHTQPGVGIISGGAGHYPTHGQTPAEPNFDVNREYAEKVSEWAIEKGKGSNLAFFAADFNMPDQKAQDVFFGGPLTTAADELKAWESTGHGPIDGIASYNRDGRVKAKSFEVFTDKENHLFSDHFPVKAVFEIRLKK